MKRYSLFFLATALLLAGLWYADTRLVAPPPPRGTPTPLPTHTPERTLARAAGRGPQVVVISLDGVGAARARDYMADGTMPNLARLAREGAMAQHSLSVDPSLRAPAHASLAAGVYPSATGIVSDRFHRAQDPLYAATDALGQPPAGAEPVWRTAMRQARRTAVLFWPGTSVDAPATLADYTVTGGAVDAASAQHEVTFTQALTWTGAPPSFSPLREGSFAITKGGGTLARVYVLAVDTTDDGQARYDTFILDRDRQVDSQSARLRAGETAPLVIDERLTSGAFFTLTRAGADRVTLFQSRVAYNRAQPNELVRELNRRFGFIPPDPDDDALEQGWISAAEYVRMAEVQSRWMISVTTFVLETYRPDLLFTWQGAADALGHRFLLVDPQQPKHTSERAAEYARYLRRGYALADLAVGELAKAVDPAETTLFVVSDHGMAPVHSQVYVNTILNWQKLLVYGAGPEFRVNVGQSKAIAFAWGGAAHVYINLQGRERAGIVPQGDYKATQDAIVKALEQARDKQGRPLFSRVVRQEDLARLGLDASSAGDVFVQAAPGFTLSDRRGYGDIVGPATCYGQHGYAATLPEMQGIFLAAGPAVRPGAQVGPVHVVDLAPTVARLLGLKAPLPYAGRVLEEVLLP